jgi:SH3-like domain-containing protein
MRIFSKTMVFRRFCAAVCVAFVVWAGVSGSVANAADAGPVTGLPMPRFAVLTRDEVNVRTGPGERYPIDWVFTRKYMPVQIVGEYEHWRKVRDFEGTEGWVHKAMLSGQKAVMFIKGGFMLRRDASYNAPPVAKVEPTVTGAVEKCADGWCLVEVGGFKGWAQHDYLWGIEIDEAF